MAPVRLPRPQRLLAARRHRVRPGRRAQGGDLPAPGRPLAPGGGLPGRPGRDQSGGHRRLRQGRSRPGRAPAPADRQRRGPQPQPARSHRPPGGARALPGRRTPRRQSPYRPTTQGKNERFGQTLLRYLDQQPLADSIAELQEQVDRFDHIYNTQRPHQGLPGRITGQQAWDATEVARAPRPGHDTDPITPGGEPARDAPAGRRPPHRRRPIAPSGERELTITRNGTVHIGGIAFLVRRALAGHRTTAIWDATTITFADVHGEVLIQYNWPPEGVTYVSHHPPDPTNQRGGRGRRRPQPSPKS